MRCSTVWLSMLSSKPATTTVKVQQCNMDDWLLLPWSHQCLKRQPPKVMVAIKSNHCFTQMHGLSAAYTHHSPMQGVNS